ncbi:MAG: class C sortase [Candidatus Microbacterium colombiense]|nr:MAG: class C sortase [Microbacterium sp.]
MVDTVVSDAPRRSEEQRSHARSGRRWSPTSVVVALVVVFGAGLIAYPSGATWISDLTHASVVSGYAQVVDLTGETELAQLRADAVDYNASLPDGPLRDPYVLNAQGGSDDLEDGRTDYLSQLSLRADAPMARISIPAIGVDLPVYHGTDDATLARGIGHLYGSGLPVGGAGTHSVLTGHSGIPGASLFTRLDEVRIDDLFTIEVAGETLTYRVDRIETVLPDDGDHLRQVAGHDYVTLLTCTPTGVNTHRLLVRGERVTTAAGADAETALAASAPPGIPWDAIAVLVGGLGIAFTIARPRPTRR